VVHDDLTHLPLDFCEQLVRRRPEVLAVRPMAVSVYGVIYVRIVSVRQAVLAQADVAGLVLERRHAGSAPLANDRWHCGGNARRLRRVPLALVPRHELVPLDLELRTRANDLAAFHRASSYRRTVVPSLISMCGRRCALPTRTPLTYVPLDERSR